MLRRDISKSNDTIKLYRGLPDQMRVLSRENIDKINQRDAQIQEIIREAGMREGRDLSRDIAAIIREINTTQGSEWYQKHLREKEMLRPQFFTDNRELALEAAKRGDGLLGYLMELEILREEAATYFEGFQEMKKGDGEPMIFSNFKISPLQLAMNFDRWRGDITKFDGPGEGYAWKYDLI